MKPDDRKQGRSDLREGDEKKRRKEGVMPVVDEKLLKESPINPRTGSVWRLTDVEIKKKVDSFQASLSDPQRARQYLVERGFITPTGRTPKKYGG